MRALLTIILIVTPGLVEAQSDPWQRFLGKWRGPGTAMGGQAVGDAQWERILQGRFVRLEMSFTIGGASSPAFGGHAYYGMGDSTGIWFDSHGNRYPIAYRIVGDTLTVWWTMTNGAQARSRYARLADGRLHERSIVIGADGHESVFLEYSFARQP